MHIAVRKTGSTSLTYANLQIRKEVNMSEKSLYERLGGIYSIAAVVEHFAKSLAEDPLQVKMLIMNSFKIGMQIEDGESRALSF